MRSNESGSQVNELEDRVFRFLARRVIVLMAVVMLVKCALLTVNMLAGRGEKKITSLEEAAYVLKIEKENLGIREEIRLDADVPHDMIAMSRKGTNDAGVPHYVISLRLDAPFGVKPAIIRHELYHIAAGHCDKSFAMYQRHKNTTALLLLGVLKRNTEYLLYEEFSAGLYALWTRGITASFLIF